MVLFLVLMRRALLLRVLILACVCVCCDVSSYVCFVSVSDSSSSYYD